MDKNLPANSGSVGLILGPGGFHMPWGQLSLRVPSDHAVR